MAGLLKYNEAKQKILLYVRSNQIALGAKLPSEQELCASMGMSNMPLRRALAELQAAGIVRKVKGVGTFLASDCAQGEILSQVGFLSVDFPPYPDGQTEHELQQRLKRRGCGLRVFRTGSEFDTGVIHELSFCDRLIVSGFMTPQWIEGVRALGKPVVLLGDTRYVTGFCRITQDYEAAFSLIFSTFLAQGLRRFGAVLPAVATTCQAREFQETFEVAAGRVAEEAHCFWEELPKQFPIAWMERFLLRRREDCEVLILGHCAFLHMLHLRNWGELVGSKPVVVLDSLGLPDDFDLQPGLFRVFFDTGIIEKVEQVLFDFPFTFIENGEVVKLPPKMALNFARTQK